MCAWSQNWVLLAAPMCALHLLFVFDDNINQKTIQSIAGRGAVSMYAICVCVVGAVVVVCNVVYLYHRIFVR